jgi:O-antigen/teichoic acid export membrane protein
MADVEPELLTAVPPPVSLGRDLTRFGLARVAGQVVSGLSAPLFARLLGPADFGVYDVLTVIYSLALTLFLLGCDQALLRFWGGEDDEPEARAVVGVSVVVPLSVSTLGLIVAVTFRRPLAELLLGDHGRGDALAVSALAVLVMNGAYLTQEVLRVRRRSAAYTRSTVLRSLVAAAAGLVLVAFGHGVAGVFAGVCVGAAAALGLNLWAARRELFPLRLTGPWIRRVLGFGLPLVPATLCYSAILIVDRLILVRFVSYEEVGLYGLANKLAGFLLLVVYGFHAGWTAYALELHTRDPASERSLRGRVMTGYFAVLVFLAATTAALSPEAVAVAVGPGFEGAGRLVPALGLAFAFFGSVPVSQIPLLVAGRTRLVSVLAFVAAAVDILGCLVLVPPFGSHGAAAATLVSFAVLAVSLVLVAGRYEPSPYAAGRLAGILAGSVPVLLLGFVRFEPLALSLGVKAAAVAGLALVLGRVGGVGPADLRRLLQGTPAS